MGHKVFLKDFDGPQKVFFIFSWLFLVTSFKKLAQGVWAQNAQTGHEGDFRKIRHVKIETKSIQLYIWQMVVKIKKDIYYAF